MGSRSVHMTAELETYLSGLVTSQGWNAGSPLMVFPWQRRFLRGVYSTDYGDAALSVARGAGKTTLVGALGAAAVDGPLVQTRGETVIVGPSLHQARISFAHIVAFVGREKLADRKTWKIWDSAQHALIENKQTGATVKCIGADPKHAHGLAPSLLILDEGAQWRTNWSGEMYATLQTSMGKIDGSRLIAVGTKPLATATHWFNDLLNGQACYRQVHAAEKDDSPFQRRTWEKACPSLKTGMPGLLRQYEEEAARAKKSPSVLAAFQSLRLNMGSTPVEVNHVIDLATWQGCERDVERGGPFILGVDLSDGSAMSAIAAFWPGSGRLEARAYFPAVPSLKERGLKDGVGSLYGEMHKRGELIVTPGRAVDVGVMLKQALHDWGTPFAIVADRYKEAELRAALDGVHFPQAIFTPRGQGFKDGAEDVRIFRRAILDNKVFPVESLLLRAAFAEAVTVSDPSGNEKQAKNAQGGRRMRARDDAASAAILAVSEGMRQREGIETSSQALRFVVAG